jgi:molecular chaperone DnaK (HSP70)
MSNEVEQTQEQEDGYKEIRLKVRVDSYKAISNCIHNELKLTKQDVEDMIAKLLSKVIENQLTTGQLKYTLEKCVAETVRDSVARLGNSSRWNLNDQIDNAIDKAIGEKIREVVNEKLKNVNVKELL